MDGFLRFFEEIGEKVSEGKKKWHKTLLLATKHLPKPQNIVIGHQIFATKCEFPSGDVEKEENLLPVQIKQLIADQDEATLKLFLALQEQIVEFREYIGKRGGEK